MGSRVWWVRVYDASSGVGLLLGAAAVVGGKWGVRLKVISLFFRSTRLFCCSFREGCFLFFRRRLFLVRFQSTRFFQRRLFLGRFQSTRFFRRRLFLVRFQSTRFIRYSIPTCCCPVPVPIPKTAVSEPCRTRVAVYRSCLSRAFVRKYRQSITPVPDSSRVREM
jgi:hypothetical protein